AAHRPRRPGRRHPQPVDRPDTRPTAGPRPPLEALSGSQVRVLRYLPANLPGAQRIPAPGHSTSSKARINGGFLRTRNGSICASPAMHTPDNPRTHSRQGGTRRASVPITLSDCGWSAAVARDPPICVMVRFSSPVLREPVHVHGGDVWPLRPVHYIQPAEHRVGSMALRLVQIAVNARDDSAVSRFWAEALGWSVSSEEPGVTNV